MINNLNKLFIKKSVCKCQNFYVKSTLNKLCNNHGLSFLLETQELSGAPAIAHVNKSTNGIDF